MIENPKFFKRLFYLQAFLVVILFGLFVFEYAQTVQLKNNFNTAFNKLDSSFSISSNDLNEVRGFLGMPMKKYATDDTSDTSDNSDSVQLSLFKYFSYLGNNEKLASSTASNLKLINSLTENKDFSQYLNNNSFKASKLANTEKDYNISISSADDVLLVYIYLEKQTGKLFLHTITETTEIKESDASNFIKYIQNFLDQNASNIVLTAKNISDKKDKEKNESI